MPRPESSFASGTRRPLSSQPSGLSERADPAEVEHSVHQLSPGAQAVSTPDRPRMVSTTSTPDTPAVSHSIPSSAVSFAPSELVTCGGTQAVSHGAPFSVIDRMRQGSIVGSVWPLHGPGRQRSQASAGQPGRTEDEDQLGPTTSHLGPCCRRTFRRRNQMCSTSSPRLRRRHHQLPGIHRRRHSDRRAATLRGSGPVSGPVAGRA